MVRNHFMKFKEVCSWLGIKVDSKVETYENDLQRELNRTKLKKEDEERAKAEAAMTLKER